ncbi:MAG: succinate dehydrogenase assembly factor 2 [Candidatus Nitricoxidivorans perseverans]|uniref:FAD assembly factor SdhE n=1 Tax=Candidatus Nitricoxidivorans perseverans TaxID=2975601 RepID=A0AA49IZ16_9PROT|nr:MAG: succinate dehydrogenase assembly factor 2 [Candidatus Nitricoxidivorans perseverans]
MSEARRVRLEKLRWRSRRALLELDIVFQRFWRETGDSLDDETMAALERLLELEDHELWERINGCDMEASTWLRNARQP